jgi:hypothetical protein
VLIDVIAEPRAGGRSDRDERAESGVGQQPHVLGALGRTGHVAEPVVQVGVRREQHVQLVGVPVVELQQVLAC